MTYTVNRLELANPQPAPPQLRFQHRCVGVVYGAPASMRRGRVETVDDHEELVEACGAIGAVAARTVLLYALGGQYVGS
jgi:hypothetical protein